MDAATSIATVIGVKVSTSLITLLVLRTGGFVIYYLQASTGQPIQAQVCVVPSSIWKTSTVRGQYANTTTGARWQVRLCQS
jgi:hypothetical protein